MALCSAPSRTRPEARRRFWRLKIPFTWPSDTLSPSHGEREGVKGVLSLFMRSGERSSWRLPRGKVRASRYFPLHGVVGWTLVKRTKETNKTKTTKKEQSMKKQISEILIVAAILCGVYGGLMASSALTSRSVGVPISDAEASTLLGGCTGVDHPSCTNGNCSGLGSIYTSGTDIDFHNTDSTTNWCDSRDHNCGSCFGEYLCTGSK